MKPRKNHNHIPDTGILASQLIHVKPSVQDVDYDLLQCHFMGLGLDESEFENDDADDFFNDISVIL